MGKSPAPKRKKWGAWTWRKPDLKRRIPEHQGRSGQQKKNKDSKGSEQFSEPSIYQRNHNIGERGGEGGCPDGVQETGVMYKKRAVKRARIIKGGVAL